MKITELIFIGALVVASLVACASFPLLTYSVSLAVFGSAHVIREFYYIDHRFGQKVDKSFAITLAILLLGIIFTRSASVFGFAVPAAMQKYELVLVFLLALSAQFHIPSATLMARSTSLFCTLLIGAGLIVSPVTTILVLAVLHNLTPIGFIVEIVKPEQKRTALLVTTFGLVLIPLLMGVGLMSVMGLPHFDDVSIFPTGPLSNHLSAFIPPALKQASWASQAFSAIVFAQCMHYVAVIYVMPKLLHLHARHLPRPLFPWPRASRIWLFIALTTAALIYVYVKDFAFARALYGIASAIHAYLEIPILLWAFFATKTTISTSMLPSMEKAAGI